VITAKPFFIPAVGISAITATTNIRLQPDTMTLVISFIEAVLTNYAGFVFFTVLTLPGYIPGL
jgi:hypothetical protein